MLCFKAISWSYEDIFSSDRDKMYIYICGLSMDLQSVFVKVKNFTPFAHLELPESGPIGGWSDETVSLLFDYFSENVWKKNTPKKWSYAPRFFLQHKKPVKTVLIPFVTNIGMKSFAKKCRENVFSHPKLGCFPKGSFKIHESNIDPILKFTTIKNIDLAGWISVPLLECHRSTCCDYETLVDWNDVKMVEKKELVRINPKYLSFDIECHSKNPNAKNPNPKIRENEIFQISVLVGILNKPETLKRFLVSRGRPQIKHVTVYHLDEEKDILLKFRDLVVEHDPDIFVGYNIIKFDWNYMLARAKMLQILEEFCKMSRISDKICKISKKEWTSSAYGLQKFKTLDCVGRIDVDLMLEIERNYRLASQKLDYVAEYFLKEHKKDITPRQLFMLFDITNQILPLFPTTTSTLVIKNKMISILIESRCTGEVHDYRVNVINATDRQTLEELAVNAMKLTGKYCVHDSWLPIRLMETLNLWDSMEAMANVTKVPLSFLHTRGQGIKTIAQLLRETKKERIVIPHIENTSEKYQGAIVLKAVPGCYDDVMLLDFQSLYPSMIIAYNICYTTFCKNPTAPDSEYHVLTFSEHNGCEHDILKRKEKVFCYDKVYRYKKPQVLFDSAGKPYLDGEGLLPKLERSLLKQRKDVKVEMEKANATTKMNNGKVTQKDLDFYKKIGWPIIEKGSLSKTESENTEIKGIVTNAVQLALKISANSAYGLLSNRQGGYANMTECAESVTAMGRNTITDAIEFILKRWKDSEIFYGDSVTGDTPLIVIIQGNLKVIPISDLEIYLHGEWIAYPEFKSKSKGVRNKQRMKVSNVFVWTSSGWKKIKKLIRHYTDKQIYRVQTKSGIVDVTKDHSLITDQHTKIKPKDVVIGQPLLTGFPHFVERFSMMDSSDSMCNDEFSVKECWVWGLFMASGSAEITMSSGKNCSWSINNKNIEILDRAKQILEKIMSLKFKILESFKLVPVGDSIHLVTLYYKHSFYNHQRIVPEFILNAPHNHKKAFFDGYYCGKGYKDTPLEFTSKNKLTTQSFYYLVKSLGYYVTIEEKQNSYCCRFFNDPISHGNCTTCTRLLHNTPNKFVYDLETEVGEFHAGIGDIIVSNTDSTTVTEKNTKGSACSTMGKFIAKATTHYIRCKFLGFVKDRVVDEEKTVTTSENKVYPIQDITSKHKDYCLLNQQDKKDVFKYEMCPITLAFESAIYRFLMITKKKYVYIAMDEDGNPGKQVNKGDPMVVKKYAAFCKKLYASVLEDVFLNKPAQAVIDKLTDGISSLFVRSPTVFRDKNDSAFNVSQLVVTTSVKDIISYAKHKKGTTTLLDKNGNPLEMIKDPLDKRLVYANLPALQLALRMLKRGDDASNSKLEYIYVKNNDALHKCDKMEEYQYYLDNNKIENLSPDLIEYVVQISQCILKVINIKFPPKIVQYTQLEDEFIRAIAKCTKSPARIDKDCNQQFLGCTDNTIVGWDALPMLAVQIKQRIHLRFLYNAQIRKILEHITKKDIHKDLLGTKQRAKIYKLCGVKAKIEYILRDKKTPQHLRELAHKLRSKLILQTIRKNNPISAEILNRVTGQYGISLRGLTAHPSRSLKTIKKGGSVILIDKSSPFCGKVCVIVEVTTITKKPEKRIFDLSVDDVIIKDVPIEKVATFIVQDKLLTKIITSRACYSEVVQEIKHIFRVCN